MKGILACALSFCLSANLLAETNSTQVDPRDPELFPAEFFPGLSERSEGELFLAGLMSLYPKKIVTELPKVNTPDFVQPVVREIGSNGVYIRVTHLPDSLVVIRENLARPLVVLDVRFLSADLDSALALGSLLTRQESLTLAVAGDYPTASEHADGSTISVKGERLRQSNQTVFTLSNHETRGPIETVLAQLMTDGEIISVGAASPGHTAVFRPFPGFDSIYLISGEIRPSNGSSLVDSGFLPRVEVNVDPAADRIGYDGLREGVTLDDLVQARVSKPRMDEARLLRGAGFLQEEENGEKDEADLPRDIILQRALNIVKALQALGKIAG